MTQIEWRFSNGDEEGHAWLNGSRRFTTYVDFRADRDGPWLRLHVATRGWIEEKLKDVRDSKGAPLVLAIPATLFLPDASGSALEGALQRALDAGGLTAYAFQLT